MSLCVTVDFDLSRRLNWVFVLDRFSTLNLIPPRIGFAHIFTLPFATVESPEFEQICVKLEDQSCWAPDFGSFFLSLDRVYAHLQHPFFWFTFYQYCMAGQFVKLKKVKLSLSVALEGGPVLFIPPGIWGELGELGLLESVGYLSDCCASAKIIPILHFHGTGWFLLGFWMNRCFFLTLLTFTFRTRTALK